MISRTGRGFTLVEMLVVLAVMAMLLAISVPFTSGFGKGLRIKTAARGILGTLRVARSNAITYRKKYTVIFSRAGNEYWIEDPDGRIFEQKRRLPASIKLESSFEDDKVIFYSTGAVEGSSGSITVTDKAGTSKIISIIASTGKITIK